MNPTVAPLSAGELSEGADINESILAASRVFVAIASRALAGLTPEITLPQLRTLVLLSANGPMGVGELATALAVVPSTATRMCDRLADKKLIRRVVDPSNRRRVSVELLPGGTELIRRSTERRQREIAHLLTSMTGPEQVQVAAALQVLVRAANEYSHDGE